MRMALGAPKIPPRRCRVRFASVTPHKKLPMSAFFVAAGEALIDLIQQPDGRYEACLGGSVFNFCIALARLRVPIAYANPLSRDPFGRRFAQRLVDDGVRMLSATPDDAPTSLAVVSLDAQGKPSYSFHRAHVADRRIDVEALLPQLAEAAGVHIGGLALVPEDVARYILIAQAVTAAGGVVSVDANLRPAVVPDAARYAEGVMQALAHGHLVKASDEDLLHLGLVNDAEDGQALVAAARSLLQRPGVATRIVALTRGAQGADLITRNLHLRAMPPDGLVVQDTVGAGDCFMAGLVAGLHAAGVLKPAELDSAPHAALESALKLAVAGASIDVTRVGCDPAQWEEADAMKARVKLATMPR